MPQSSFASSTCHTKSVAQEGACAWSILAASASSFRYGGNLQLLWGPCSKHTYSVYQHGGCHPASMHILHFGRSQKDSYTAVLQPSCHVGARHAITCLLLRMQLGLFASAQHSRQTWCLL